MTNHNQNVLCRFLSMFTDQGVTNTLTMLNVIVCTQR